MAAKFLISGGTGNWNSTSNWATTSGGASGAAFPTVSDDVILDGHSNANLTVNVASACLSFSASPTYTNTLTMTSTLTSSGNVTLGSGMTISGAGALIANATSTLTSNGKVWTGALTLSTSSTKTLADNWIVNGLCTSLTLTQTVNNPGSLILNGGLTMTAAMNGTAQVILQGGTLSGAGILANPLAFSGNCTLGTFSFGAAGSPLMSYSAGTVSTAGSVFNTSSNATINCSAVTFNNVVFGSSAGVITLSDNLNLSGTVSSGAATTTTLNGAFNINVLNKGIVSIGTNWGGTATINFTSGGAFSGATSASILSNPTIINTTGASFNSFTYRTNVMSWNQVGASTFGASTILLNTNPTWMINTTGLSLNTLQVGSSTVSAIFSGSNGFSMNNYLCTAAAANKSTWKSGNTYTINTSLSANTTLAFAHVWASSTPGQRYFITLAPGCNCDVLFASITDADSSQGRTGWNNKGTLSNCVNWNLLPSSPIQYNSII